MRDGEAQSFILMSIEEMIFILKFIEAVFFNFGMCNTLVLFVSSSLVAVGFWMDQEWKIVYMFEWKVLYIMLSLLFYCLCEFCFFAEFLSYLSIYWC